MRCPSWPYPYPPILADLKPIYAFGEGADVEDPGLVAAPYVVVSILNDSGI
jgi:hypothetical protein